MADPPFSLKFLVDKFEARLRAQCRQRGRKGRVRQSPSKAGKEDTSPVPPSFRSMHPKPSHRRRYIFGAASAGGGHVSGLHIQCDL